MEKSWSSFSAPIRRNKAGRAASRDATEIASLAKGSDSVSETPFPDVFWKRRFAFGSEGHLRISAAQSGTKFSLNMNTRISPTSTFSGIRIAPDIATFSGSVKSTSHTCKRTMAP